MRKLSKKKIKEIETDIKLLLHAARDHMRRTSRKSHQDKIPVHNTYYCQALGEMRALEVLDYGKWKSPFLDGTKYDFELPEQNLCWWFEKIYREVHEEEGFYDGTHRCEYCLKTYGRDDLTEMKRE